MREKMPSELRKQEEMVQLERILSGKDKAANPEELAHTLRELRQSTGLDAEKIDVQDHDLHEAKEYQIEQGMESAIIRGVLAGEGKHGLVLRISTDDIPETAKKLLVEDGIEFSDPSASKVLKVYQHGVAREELEAQSRAYEAISAVENPDDYLHVPRPIGFIDTRLTQNTIDSLRSRSKRYVALADRAEIIFMEFIEGQELLERLYDFVLQAKRYPEHLLTVLTFEQKEELVTTNILKFNNPGGKSSVESERLSEKTQIENQNAERLAEFLIRYRDMPDFPLSAEFLDKLDRTVKYLHSKGIFHGDLHERNIMIDNDGIGYLIDFGLAGEKDNNKRSDDGMIVRRYRSQLKETY